MYIRYCDNEKEIAPLNTSVMQSDRGTEEYRIRKLFKGILKLPCQNQEEYEHPRWAPRFRKSKEFRKTTGFQLSLDNWFLTFKDKEIQSLSLFLSSCFSPFSFLLSLLPFLLFFPSNSLLHSILSVTFPSYFLFPWDICLSLANFT